MDTNTRNKWQVRAAALVIFLLGAAAGTLAPRVYYGWLREKPAQERSDRFAEMSDRLQLSDDQKAQVQQIFGDTREQLRSLRKDSAARVTEIRRQADERLQKVLTPEQWQRFQQVKEEMRHNRRGRGRGDAPPDVK
ncbi:MAG: motif family protein [Acidobacteriota bacterium]|jgi:Spy/CpxP family protein refolding chaperone|nr:motif family protein [Acidobacteriota bacterium]